MSKSIKVAVIALLSSSVAFGVACGGSDTNSGTTTKTDGGGSREDSGGDDDSTAQPDSSIGTGDEDSGSTGGDDSATPDTDGGAPGDGSVGDAGDAGDGGVLADGAADAAPPYTGIACGNSVCRQGTEVCCNRPASTLGSRDDVCVAPSQCGDGGIIISCNKPSDCTGGTVCCATYQPGGGILIGSLGTITNVSCQATCDRTVPDGGSTRYYRVCDRNTNPPCPNAGEQCSQAMSATPAAGLSGVLVCQ